MSIQKNYDKYLSILNQNDKKHISYNIDSDNTLYVEQFDSGTYGIGLSWKLKRRLDVFSDEDINFFHGISFVYYPSMDGKIELTINEIHEINNDDEYPLEEIGGIRYLIIMDTYSRLKSIDKIKLETYFTFEELNNLELKKESIGFVMENMSTKKEELQDIYKLNFDYKIPAYGLFNTFLDTINIIENLDLKNKLKNKKTI